MNRNIPKPSRRSVLKTIGGGAVAAGVGGAALLASTGPAAAATQDYGSVTIESDDGTVEYVAIHGDSTVEWTGFDTEATQFSIDIDGRVGTSGSWTDLSETGRVALDNSNWGNYDEDLSGPGTSGYIESGIGLDESGNLDETIDWHIVGSDPDGYGLPDQNRLPESALLVDTDGESENYTVQVRSTYRWYDDGDNEIFSEEFIAPVDVTVNNIESSASGSGSGGATGE